MGLSILLKGTLEDKLRWTFQLYDVIRMDGCYCLCKNVDRDWFLSKVRDVNKDAVLSRSLVRYVKNNKRDGVLSESEVCDVNKYGVSDVTAKVRMLIRDQRSGM